MGDFALAAPGIDYASWVFQLSFAATAATIVSGAVAGRIKFKLYVVLSIVVTSIVYPIPAHVAWDPRGFGYQLGFVDFAGSGVVHAAGGLMGLMSTMRLGPRTGVFSASGAYFPVRSSPTTAILGVFILIWCWFSFNAGSTTSVSNGADLVAALAAVNTAMASGAGSVAGMLFSYGRSGGRYIDIYETANGSLCALVGITASCASVQPWEAAIIGAIAAVLGNWVSGFLVRFRIDDPVGVTPVHLVCGSYGALMVGLFANDPTATPNMPVPHSRAGLFHGGGFHQLGIQALILVFILTWSFVMYGAVLLLLDYTLGLRVGKDEERMLDALEHNLLMVKVQEAIGATGSTEGDESYDGGWVDREHDLERGGRVHPDGGSSRILAAQGQLMTMDAGLDQQPRAVTMIQSFDEADEGLTGVTDGAAVRRRNANDREVVAITTAAGPHGLATQQGDAHASSGTVRTVASSQRAGRRMSAPMSRRAARRSTSTGGQPRRKRSKGGGRRRSMVYMTEEVTYMTAEEMAAVHSGQMDETTVDRAIPAELSKHMASASKQAAGIAGRSVLTGSAESAQETGPAVHSGSRASASDAKVTAGSVHTAEGISTAAPSAGAPDEGRREAGQGRLAQAGRQGSSRKGPRRTGSRAVMDVQGWQAPDAVAASRLPGPNPRSSRDVRRVQFQAQEAGGDRMCAQQ